MKPKHRAYCPLAKPESCRLFKYPRKADAMQLAAWQVKEAQASQVAKCSLQKQTQLQAESVPALPYQLLT